jgi:hypothetical protein
MELQGFFKDVVVVSEGGKECGEEKDGEEVEGENEVEKRGGVCVFEMSE